MEYTVTTNFHIWARGPQGPRAQTLPPTKSYDWAAIEWGACAHGVYVHHELSHLGPGAPKGPGPNSPPPKCQTSKKPIIQSSKKPINQSSKKPKTKVWNLGLSVGGYPDSHISKVCFFGFLEHWFIGFLVFRNFGSCGFLEYWLQCIDNNPIIQ